MFLSHIYPVSGEATRYYTVADIIVSSSGSSKTLDETFKGNYAVHGYEPQLATGKAVWFKPQHSKDAFGCNMNMKEM